MPYEHRTNNDPFSIDHSAQAGLHLLEVSFALLDVPVFPGMTDSDRSCYVSGAVSSSSNNDMSVSDSDSHSVSATASVAFYFVDKGTKCGIDTHADTVGDVDVVQARLIDVDMGVDVVQARLISVGVVSGGDEKMGYSW